MADKANETTASVESNEVATPAPAATNGNLSILMDADKVKQIRSKLGDRTTFETEGESTAYAQAEAHLTKASGETSNFHGLAIFTGKDIESANRLVVATVGIRDKEAKRNGYKAIVVFTQPSIQDFLTNTSDEAIAFVNKLIEREATDVAFAGIRTAETMDDMQTVMTGLPITVEDIVTVSRSSGGLGDSIFGDFWADFRKGVLKTKYAKLDEALPQKPEFIKALRSSSYAKANPATAELESRGYIKGIGELFVKAVEKIAEQAGEEVDTDTVKGWIANRDTLNIDYSVKAVTVEDNLVLEL